MVTTNNKALYEKLCLFRTHGITRNEDLMTENHGGWYYQMIALGYNYRLTELQAALGISQLAKAPERLKNRQEIAKRYDQAFLNCEHVKTLRIADDVNHAYHLYVIQVENRKELYDYLRDNNIFSQVHYIPLHTMPFYKNHTAEQQKLPMAESYYKHCLSLPMYPTLTSNEQDYVIKSILSFFNK